MDEDIESKERWPQIQPSELGTVRDRICERVRELEVAFEAGTLPFVLAGSDDEALLGPHLFNVYAKLSTESPGPTQHLRMRNVETSLLHFQNDLTPVETAMAIGPVEDIVDDVEPEITLKGVKACMAGGAWVPVRGDQITDARFWRIGFQFYDPVLQNRYASELLRRTTHRLATDLNGLRRVLSRFRPVDMPDRLVIIPGIDDRKLEQLFLNILNEDIRRAAIAPVTEDFLEKTDLRVRYPNLDRKRGARVQVTSIIASKKHRLKRDAIQRTDEYVFLSPLSLAQFLIAAGEQEGCLSEESRQAVWECLDADPDFTEGIAFEIRHLLVSAMESPFVSPLGPVGRVPPAIRQLVRTFVQTMALDTTARMRQRQKEEAGEDTLEPESPSL